MLKLMIRGLRLITKKQKKLETVLNRTPWNEFKISKAKLGRKSN